MTTSKRSEWSFWATDSFHFFLFLSFVTVLPSWSPGSDRSGCMFCTQSVSAAQGTQGGVSYTISGSITPAPNGSGATISLSGTVSLSTTADNRGVYTFRGVANGRYAVTPSKDGFEFAPRTQIVTVNNGDASGVDFTATTTEPTYTISGTISPPASGSGSTVALSGAASATTTADASGNYSFSGLSNGSYTVTPEKHRATFTPARQAVIVTKSDVSGVNFAIAVRGSE